jgi:hypothetical protein
MGVPSGERVTNGQAAPFYSSAGKLPITNSTLFPNGNYDIGKPGKDCHYLRPFRTRI